MLQPPSPFALRPLQLADIDAMLPIEQHSFPTPVKASTYVYELTENRLAHYQALTAGDRLIGYAGYWLIADEAHVSIIAVDPGWRGRGLGELLLLNVIAQARAAGAALVTLEVRENNITAQQLYAKCRFEVVGRRRRYYRDTGEDAILMTLPLDDNTAVVDALLFDGREALFARLAGEDSAG